MKESWRKTRSGHPQRKRREEETRKGCQNESISRSGRGCSESELRRKDVPLLIITQWSSLGAANCIFNGTTWIGGIRIHSMYSINIKYHFPHPSLPSPLENHFETPGEGHNNHPRLLERHQYCLGVIVG